MSTSSIPENTLSQSLLHRLAHTPMRDVLRGRLTCRLDYEAAIRAARLPWNVSDLIRAVVRATRLSRIERADLARELAAHFQDGLALHADAQRMLSDFGDPRAAAALIRRAKLRQRPLTWQMLSWTSYALGVALLLSLLLYAFLALRLFTATPNIARNHLAELNAPALAIQETQRAWQLYREVAIALESVPDWDELGHAQPDAPRWPELLAYLARNERALQLIHAASQRPHLGIVLTTDLDPLLLAGRAKANDPAAAAAVAATTRANEAPNPLVLSVLLPHVSELRMQARALRLAALAAGARGDADAAVRHVEAMIAISDHAFETPILICDLVAFSVLTRACGVVDELLHRYPELLRGPQLVRIAHRLGAALGGGVLRARVENERRACEDVLQRIYSDDGRGDGRISAAGLQLLDDIRLPPNEESGPAPLKPLMGAILVGRAEMSQKMERIFSLAERESRLPLWQRNGSAADRALQELGASDTLRARYLPLWIMAPSLSNAGAQGEILTVRRDATLVMLALQAYRERNGTYPASLVELTPTFIPSVPLDRFDGAPLRYRLVAGQPLLYSVGVDGDDDQGRVPAGREGNERARRWGASPSRAGQSTSETDGDWQLFPPVFVTPVERAPSEDD